MKNRIYLDIHVLQTVPPSCVNRDDTGSPKTAVYGGTTRARVSSQAWKSAMRKMFRAAELLRGTDMKIIDIAEEVGYCNASKFASAFRDVVGRAPRDYRTEHKLTASSAKCAVKAS